MSRSNSSVRSRMGGLVAAKVCGKDEKAKQRRRIVPEAIVPMSPTESL